MKLAMKGNLKIVKTSSDGKVKGFAFRITGANGYDIILETNDKGEIFIDELRIGDYTISEVSNSASSMYVLPADKKATIESALGKLKEAHKNADVAAIDTAIAELNAAWQAASQDIYAQQQAQGAQQNAGQQQSNQGAQSNGGNGASQPEDVEFEEVK